MTKRNEFQNHYLKKRAETVLPMSTIFVLSQIHISFFGYVLSKFVKNFDQYSKGYNGKQDRDALLESLDEMFPTVYGERNS